ncbi:hypothetical protein EVAR_39163_1 [Eumeta japonica]|uniref:Uncharacterized protein n=1 Tax=Eumeta variegata TaxID=151549 RepID=A0A4C1XA14_EUMVA|nr:hypothetical protein EVAR_39163_1 [Eumeta japonica]
MRPLHYHDKRNLARTSRASGERPARRSRPRLCGQNYSRIGGTANCYSWLPFKAPAELSRVQREILRARTTAVAAARALMSFGKGFVSKNEMVQTSIICVSWGLITTVVVSAATSSGTDGLGCPPRREASDPLWPKLKTHRQSGRDRDRTRNNSSVRTDKFHRNKARPLGFDWPGVSSRSYQHIPGQASRVANLKCDVTTKELTVIVTYL